MRFVNNKNKHQLSKVQLWACWIVPAASWALHLFVSYSLIESHCQISAAFSEQAVYLTLLLMTMVCFVIAAFCGFASYSAYAANQSSENIENVQRNRFMTLGGVILGSFLAIVILVQAWPWLMLPLCTQGGL